MIINPNNPYVHIQHYENKLLFGKHLLQDVTSFVTLRHSKSKCSVVCIRVTNVRGD